MVLEQPAMANDSRFDSNAKRVAKCKDLYAMIDEKLLVL
jgi:crotonobetainyl-CoA:carnitine CoA-transferase CaiB-like acyl-CoA transferase